METLKENTGDLSDLIPEDQADCTLDWVHLFKSTTLANDKFIKQHCSKPWCRDCERARVWRMRDRIIRYVEEHHNEFRSWYFITRSVRNDLNLKTAFVDLRLAQQKFTTDFKDDIEHPWNYVTHWIGVTEVTHSATTGYNVHQHMLVQTAERWTPHSKFLIGNSWSRAAGYPAIKQIKFVNDLHSVVGYIAKYLSKRTWGGLSRGRSYLCRHTLKGRNRIGCKRGTALPKPRSDHILCCLPPIDDCAHPYTKTPLQ